MGNRPGSKKHPHFRIGKNVDGDGAFLEADIESMQPNDADRHKGRVKRRIEALHERRETMKQLLEVWNEDFSSSLEDNSRSRRPLSKREKN